MIKFKKRFDKLKFANLPNTKELAIKYGYDKIIKLNYNENKFGPTPNVKNMIKIQSPNIYPEYKSPLMNEALANVYDLSNDNFYVSNGSDAILDYIPTLFASKTHNHNIIIPELTYGRIETTAIVNDITVKKINLVNDKIDLDKTFNAIDENTSIVYIVNPNMPHGTTNAHDSIVKFLKKVPDHILVVIDEAYAEYSWGVKRSFELSASLIKKFDNVLITRTFSKMFGLASFRIGYCIASEDIVNLFRMAAQVVPVNKYSLQAARAALSDIEYYEDIRLKTIEQRNVLYDFFDKQNIEYVKTSANFILIKIENPKEVRQFILEKKGLMIRVVRDFGLRLTIGTADEVKKTIEGFKEYLDKNDKS